VVVTASPGNGPPVTHGSYVNLTRLLRTSNLSLVDFFDKSRKWGDMTNMNQEFRSKIERLERNFAVTTVIFKKFEPIFRGIFKDFSRPAPDEIRSGRKK
jgi:retinoblastoma-like protein 1